jgi:hypothetical protein
MFQVFDRPRNASSLKWLRDTRHNDSQNNDTKDADILQKALHTEEWYAELG